MPSLRSTLYICTETHSSFVHAHLKSRQHGCICIACKSNWTGHYLVTKGSMSIQQRKSTSTFLRLKNVINQNHLSRIDCTLHSSSVSEWLPREVVEEYNRPIDDGHSWITSPSLSHTFYIFSHRAVFAAAKESISSVTQIMHWTPAGWAEHGQDRLDFSPFPGHISPRSLLSHALLSCLSSV